MIYLNSDLYFFELCFFTNGYIVANFIFYKYLLGMNISSSLRKLVSPVLITVGTMTPINTCHYKSAQLCDVFEKSCKIENVDSVKKMLSTMPVVNDTNFVGGVTKTYSAENIKKIKSKIKRRTDILDYELPIKNSKNVYVEPFGMFFAKRPNGRPHLGLDIFVSPYAKKPEQPVYVTSPISGVVVSNKKANPNDNVVANCVGILGVDGKRYAFDHLARQNDYKESVKMPNVGDIVQKGDTIGIVGSTGETSLWHLHMTVTSDEQLEKQKKSKMWQDVSKISKYSSLRGQSDPLNEKESGFIAKLLNNYRKTNLKQSKELLLPYDGNRDYLNK